MTCMHLGVRHPCVGQQLAVVVPLPPPKERQVGEAGDRFLQVVMQRADVVVWGGEGGHELVGGVS